MSTYDLVYYLFNDSKYGIFLTISNMRSSSIDVISPHENDINNDILQWYSKEHTHI
jgi:hypothetical protein